MTDKFLELIDRKAKVFLDNPSAASDIEKQRARVTFLMAEASAKKSLDEQAKMLDLADVEYAKRTPAQKHSSALTMMEKDASGKYVARTVFFGEPTKAVLALMVARPVIFTGLVWNGLSMSERVDLLKLAGRDSDLAIASSVLEVFPPATLDYIVGWQKAINSGDAWSSSQSVGEAGEWMLTEGYCLRGGATTTDSYGHEQLTRKDLRAGKPGTFGYVKAMMGEAYLLWLQQQEVAL